MPETDRAWALPAAAAWAALENAGILGALLFLGDVPPLIPVFLLAKFPFCVGLLQRKHGAFLFLTFWEATLLVIALINPAIDLLPRLAIVGGALAGLTLLGMSLRLFPETTLPERRPHAG